MVADFIYDLKHKKPDDPGDAVYVARAIKSLGNARIEIVYSKHKDRALISQVKIPGKFTGRAKKAVSVEPGTYLLVADTGLVGSLSLEMLAIITPSQMIEIKDLMVVHPNILSVVTDTEELVGNTANEQGFEFEKQDDDEIDIDNI
jgi:hypothetical protein